MGDPYKYKGYFDFSGGINDTVAEVNVGAKEASEARNIDLDRDGVASRRKGANLLNPTSQLTGEIGLVHQFSPARGATELVVAHDDKIQKWNGAETFTELIAGLAGVDEIVLAADYKIVSFLMNLTDNPMIYVPGGTPPYIYRPGAPAPTQTPNGSFGGSGNIRTAGNYLFRYRFYSDVDKDDVGEPYPPDGVLVTKGGGSGQALQVTNLETAPPPSGVPSWRIAGRVMERTVVNGGTFYVDGYIENTVDTTYNFVDDDPVLIEKNVSPPLGYRQPMPPMYPLINYSNRIVGALRSDEWEDLGRIVWSEIDEFGVLPWTFPAVNFVYLDVRDWSDAPVAVQRLGEYLVWYCGKSIHLMHIDEGGAPYVRRLGGIDLGFPSPRCVVEVPGGNLVWTYKGPYFFDGSNMIFIGERIEETIKSIPKSTLMDMYAVHRTQEQRRQVKFVMPGSGQKNNKAIIYHYRRETMNPEGFPTYHAWTTADGFEAKSGIVSRQDTTNLEVELEGDYNGFLYQADVTDQNDHDPGPLRIDSVYQTGWLDMDEPHMVKDFEDLWVFLTGSQPNTLAVSWETEGKVDTGVSQLGAGPDGSATLRPASEQEARFDEALFDQAFFVLGDAKILHTKLARDGDVANGRYLRLRFANSNPNEPWSLAGFIVKYSINRDRND